jgi:hypothetical protein
MSWDRVLSQGNESSKSVVQDNASIGRRQREFLLEQDKQAGIASPFLPFFAIR